MEKIPSRNGDFAVITETWMNKKLASNNLNPEYLIFLTIFSKHQGLTIVAKIKTISNIQTKMLEF